MALHAIMSDIFEVLLGNGCRFYISFIINEVYHTLSMRFPHYLLNFDLLNLLAEF